jgi:hypothetical protein
MKKSILLLVLLAIIAGGCSVFKSFTGARKQSIVGIWDFPDRRMLMQITETRMGKFWGEKPGDEYRLEGNHIIISSDSNLKKMEYEMPGGNVLWLTDGRREYVGRRLEINPAENQSFETGKYSLDEDNRYYFELTDGNNARFVESTKQVDTAKYLIHKTKLYFVHNGKYVLFEIKDSNTFQGLTPGEWEGLVFRREEDAGVSADEPEADENETGKAVKYTKPADDSSNRILIKDVDNDLTADTVFFDSERKTIVCLLSRSNFKPVESLPVEEPDLIVIDEEPNGFSFANHWNSHGFYNYFCYDEATGRMRLREIEQCEWINGSFRIQFLINFLLETWAYHDRKTNQYLPVPFTETDRQKSAVYLEEFNEKVDFDYEAEFNEGLQSGSLKLPEPELTDIDGDTAADSVYFDTGNRTIVCKLSSLNFKPAVSGQADVDAKIVRTADGFYLAKYDAEDKSYVVSFRYEPETKRIRLVQMEGILDMKDKINAHSLLNLLTGEFTGVGSYYWQTYELFGLPEISEKMPYPATYLEDFGTETVSDYEAMYMEIFNTRMEKEKIKNGHVEKLSDENEKEIEIAVLSGTVELECRLPDNFYCIGLGLIDKKFNISIGTYMEIKKQGNSYLRGWSDKKHATVHAAIEDFLQELFKDFYAGENEEKRGREAWRAFVEEGGLQRVFDFADEVIDETFLTSPWNEKYG